MSLGSKTHSMWHLLDHAGHPRVWFTFASLHWAAPSRLRDSCRPWPFRRASRWDLVSVGRLCLGIDYLKKLKHRLFFLLILPFYEHN